MEALEQDHSAEVEAAKLNRADRNDAVTKLEGQLQRIQRELQ